jgi:hypothetical protein
MRKLIPVPRLAILHIDESTGFVLTLPFDPNSAQGSAAFHSMR